MFSFNYFYLFQQQQIFIKDKKGEHQSVSGFGIGRGFPFT